MTRLVWTFLAIMAGALLGLGLTAFSVEQAPNFGVIEAGPWIARPRIGAADADPYSKALMARRGQIPVSAAEGLMLEATRDSTGRPLSGDCSYRITGPIPQAAYWTLTAYRPDGSTGEQTGGRGSYTSSELLQFEGEAPEIFLSPDPHPGNWLPLKPGVPFDIVLRLYESQVASSVHALDVGAVPSIFRTACR